MQIEFLAPNWSGAVAMTVNDNSAAPSRVLDLNDPWSVDVDIDVVDDLNLLSGEFDVHLFAESFGPGPEARIGGKLVPISPGSQTYHVHIEVPGNVFDPSTNPPLGSSYYKLVTVIEHRNVAGAETVIAGFAEARPVLLRNP